MPAEGWACLGMFPVILLMVPIVVALERRRLRRAGAAFLRGRQAMPDAEFLARAGAGPDEAALFLAGRRAMAELCGVPGDMIGPADTVHSLLNLQWDNGYVDDFVFALECRMGGCLPLGPVPERMTFGDYLRALHRQWTPPAAQRADGAQPGTAPDWPRD